MPPTPPFDPEPCDNNPPILGLDGDYITRRTEYKRLRPLPKDPIPWKTSAPCPHDQLKPGTTRYIMLRDDQIRPEDVQTDYEIQYLGDHGRLGHERWAPETLKNLDTQHDVPQQNSKWKTDAYYKMELEDYILDESKPQIHRIRALRDRIAACTFHYARHDLIEKGLAMLHELKFWTQGYRDWGMILFYTRQLKMKVQEGQDKDTHDPRWGQYWCNKITAPFIVEGLIQSMHLRTFDVDREFSRVFGLESSPRVKRGESPVEWEGYNNAGPVDWGFFRARQSLTNGTANGHATPNDAGSEDQEPSAGEDEEDDESDETDEERNIEESEHEGINDDQTFNGTNGPGHEVEDENDESDLEEISGEAFRESSLARESPFARDDSAMREVSSDIEIIGSQFIRDSVADQVEDCYSEDDGGSQVSAVNDYSEEEDGMLYGDEAGYSEDGYSEEDGGEIDDSGEDTARQPHSRLGSRVPAEVDDYSDDDDDGAQRSCDTQESEDNVSIVDSDDLQILEEHHYEKPALDDEQVQDSTVYAIRAAKMTGVDPEQAGEVFDEQGRPYDNDLAEMEYGERSLFDDEQQEFVPDSLDQDYKGYDGLDDNNEAFATYQSFPANDGTFSQAIPKADREMVEIDPALMENSGFAAITMKAVEHAGAGPDASTAAPSGLSSPPLSHQAEYEIGEAEDLGHASSPLVLIEETPDNEFSMTVQGDDSQVRPCTANSGTKGQSIAEGSPKEPHTPKRQRVVSGSFSTPGRSQEITPFRMEHPRTATGIIFVPDAPELLGEVGEDEPKEGSK